jgi:septal ring-binding cell division protein DamX
LLAAFAAGTHTVTPDLVRAAITDTRIVVPNTNKRRAAIWLAVLTSLIAGLVIGFFGGLAARQDTTPSSVGSLDSTPTNAARPTVASVPSLPPPATKLTIGAKEWLGARIAADMARIEKQPRGRYSIQLMTADERERSAIEAYLRAASRELNPERVMVYLSGTAENPKLSVLYGNYADRTEATAELSSLPQKINQFRPYARSFQAVRDDFRKSAP